MVCCWALCALFQCSSLLLLPATSLCCRPACLVRCAACRSSGFSSCEGDKWCIGGLAVLRLSFGLFFFFFLMLLLTLGNQEEDSCADRIHVGWWPPKILAWLLLLFLPFLIPPGKLPLLPLFASPGPRCHSAWLSLGQKPQSAP